MPQLCAARTCSSIIPHRAFMCRAHWFLVPSRIQDDVMRLVRPTAEGASPATFSAQSPEWQKAAKAAIAFVANHQGYGLRLEELQALAHYHALTPHLKVVLDELEAGRLAGR